MVQPKSTLSFQTWAHPTLSCAEGYHLLSESQLERSGDATLSHCSSTDTSNRTFVTEGKYDRGHSSQVFHQIMEDLPTSAQSANADAVSEWVSSFNSSGVDFVAMEF